MALTPIFGTLGVDIIGGGGWIEALDGDDTLTGSGGDDALDGGSGFDVMDGSSGNDTYVIDTFFDDVEESGVGTGSDSDRVLSYVSIDLSDTFFFGNGIVNVENVRLIKGDPLALLDVFGNDLDNEITGNNGVNTLAGGLGNDVYILHTTDFSDITTGQLFDTIIENPGEGTDSFGVDFSLDLRLVNLPANVEGIKLMGSANLTATGNAGDNLLTANDGKDKLIGGDGNDTYVVDSTGDTITELAGAAAGTADEVQSSVTYTLAKLANVENLTLEKTASINGTGNAANNIITGNDGSNTLDGAAGADTLAGGKGSDTYVIDNAGDKVNENGGEGFDTVLSSVTADFTGLNLTGELEDLTLTGVAAINGTGNNFDNTISGNKASNTIVGNGGNDHLNGSDGNDTIYGDDIANLIPGGGNDAIDGGKGNDIMIGGQGDDTYTVDSSFDTVTENAGEGTDLIKSSVTFDMSVQAPGEVENLTLTGSGNINGIGNNTSNIILGNNAANTLAGGGGDDTVNGSGGNDHLWGDLTNGTGNGNDTLDGGGGVDTMTGGMGNDLYIVDNSTDVIVELSGVGSGTDTVNSTTSYTLSANLENLSLNGGTTGTGNILDNVIIGNGSNNNLNGLDGSDTLDGMGGNDTLDGGNGVDTMSGSTGNDTYIVDNALDVVMENAGEGALDTVQASVTYVLAPADATHEVENLTLTGVAAINGTGNALDNIMTGNSAVNILAGGAGNDTYMVTSTEDDIVENTGEGTDTVKTTVNFTLAPADATHEVENLTLLGVGALNGTGNDLNNLITGNNAVNTMTGGLGDDTYVIDSKLKDVVVELAGQGTHDTVETNFTYILNIANVEDLTLTGAADINGTGDGNANIVTGNDGNNTLDGAGGDDTMAGGLGNDVFLVNSLLDVANENPGEGSDTVIATVGAGLYTLTAEVENLTLLGGADTNGTGNALANILIGNTGVNILTGLDGNDSLDGGAGADTMVGGLGNDVYTVDNTADVITENVGEGTDQVNASASYTLSADVDNLTLTGLNAINGTGNALANIILGNSGVNTLDGAGGDDTLTGDKGNDTLIGGAADAGKDTLDGGVGADTMAGGDGDDIYIVDNIGDVVTETPGQGIDLVKSSITYTLGPDVDNLTLTGSSALNGTGNALANVITGNGAVNTLEGGGGNDTLIGGGGNDVYIIDSGTEVIDESSGSGTDLVLTALSYDMNLNTLGAVDNLTMTGNGNINANGNASNNIFHGNSGANAFDGGGGDDTYFVSTGDTVNDTGGTTLDTIMSDVSFDLNINGQGVEILTLTGVTAINGTGNNLDNTFNGNTANNVFTDVMGGNDTYVVTAGDTVTDVGGTKDIVKIAFSGNLTTDANWSGIEGITLTGTSKLNATGDVNVNILTGNDGVNTLDGLVGADTMDGGKGNDVYHVDNGGDVCHEANGDGIDIVFSTVTYNIGAGPEALSPTIDNLTLVDDALHSPINGFGNNLDNIIMGTIGDNILTGGGGNDTLNGGKGGNDQIDGGAGDDIMNGDGKGDTVYGVDSLGDVIKDGGGTDTVDLGFAIYTLGKGLENLDCTNSAIDYTVTGNELNNIIHGNTGVDFIDGGKGADTMFGGANNDTYILDNLGDSVIENVGEGLHDLVKSASVSIDLSAGAFFGQEIEDATLTGKAKINVTGNDLDNNILGNDGVNTLDGGNGNDTLEGGLGNDILTGGAGIDDFVISRDAGVDHITDFDPLNDHLSFRVDIDPLTQVVADYTSSKFVGADTYIYLAHDNNINDTSPTLVAILDNIHFALY